MPIGHLWSIFHLVCFFLFVCFQFFCCFVFSLEILPVKLIASFLEDHRNSIQTSFMDFPDEGNCIS